MVGEQRPAARRVICDRCGEVIGVYEPAVLVVNDRACNTSFAAEPTLLAQAGACFHRGCYSSERERSLTRRL